MADVDVIPGLFKLALPINDKNINQDTVQRKLLDIEQDLRTRLDRPEELAILNLLGVLKFALKRYDESQAHFHAVLEKDPDNLNAMADMQHVLRAVYRKADARCYQDKLEGLIGQTKKKRVIKALARCLAEQAYVYAVDMHTDDGCYKRYEQSNTIFEKALQCAGVMVDTSEKDFWEFFIAKNLHKLFTQLRYRDNHSKANKHMEKVIGLFFKIANRNPGDSEYQWESWRHLADLARTIKTIKHFSYGHFQPQMLRDCINEPEMCMKRAMKISPDNPRFLARYANFVYSLKREACYRTALEMLDKSISLDCSSYNFYAFSTRGMIYIKNYQWQMRKYNEVCGRYVLPHPNMLEKAKADLEKAVQFRNTAWDLLNLATVYHLFAKCDTVVPPEKQRQYLELELVTLKRCEDCNDHSDRQQKLQQTFGRCFFDLGDYHESIGCFKKAMLLESSRTQYPGYFREMFCSCLSLLRNEYKDEVDTRPLLEDMVQSIRKAMTKYGSGCLTRYCFTLNLQKEYDHELQMLYNYCEQIEDNLDILTLLKPADELSSQFAPIGPGGTLKESWDKPIPKSTLDKMARESRTRKVKTHASDAAPKRDAGSAGSDTQGDGKGIGPLVSGFRGTMVRNSSGQEPSGSRSDVRLAASQSEGSDTLKEDEGLGPLVSGFRGTMVRNSPGQEPPGSRSDARLASLSEGSDTLKEDEGIGPLVSGLRDMEIRVPSGLDVHEPGGQPRSAVESPPSASSRQEEHMYDFYVVHGESDDEWVDDTLLRELETVRDLKGCTYTKDAPLGSFLYSGKLELMKQCACILVLHGEGFKDRQYLVQHALKLQREYGSTIIPIEREGILVPDDLSVMKSFDARAGRANWDRLAQSIKNTKGAPSYRGMQTNQRCCPKI